MLVSCWKEIFCSAWLAGVELIPWRLVNGWRAPRRCFLVVHAHCCFLFMEANWRGFLWQMMEMMAEIFDLLLPSTLYPLVINNCCYNPISQILLGFFFLFYVVTNSSYNWPISFFVPHTYARLPMHREYRIKFVFILSLLGLWVFHCNIEIKTT